jgi:hypothetical protein
MPENTHHNYDLQRNKGFGGSEAPDDENSKDIPEFRHEATENTHDAVAARTEAVLALLREILADPSWTSYVVAAAIVTEGELRALDFPTKDSVNGIANIIGAALIKKETNHG